MNISIQTIPKDSKRFGILRGRVVDGPEGEIRCNFFFP